MNEIVQNISMGKKMVSALKTKKARLEKDLKNEMERLEEYEEKVRLVQIHNMLILIF
jgi:hypothetical protein